MARAWVWPHAVTAIISLYSGIAFSTGKVGGNTQVCCSERRARKEKLFRGTFASLDHCPVVRRGTTNCLSYNETDHEEMLLSPPRDLLAQREGRVLPHALLLLTSFRTFQLSNLPLHKIFYGHSCLTFQFPQQVHLDLFSQERKRMKSSISF